jgi:hypothetical protein
LSGPLEAASTCLEARDSIATSTALRQALGAAVSRTSPGKESLTVLLLTCKYVHIQSRMANGDKDDTDDKHDKRDKQGRRRSGARTDADVCPVPKRASASSSAYGSSFIAQHCLCCCLHCNDPINPPILPFPSLHALRRPLLRNPVQLPRRLFQTPERAARHRFSSRPSKGVASQTAPASPTTHS